MKLCLIPKQTVQFRMMENVTKSCQVNRTSVMQTQGLVIDPKSLPDNKAVQRSVSNLQPSYSLTLALVLLYSSTLSAALFYSNILKVCSIFSPSPVPPPFYFFHRSLHHSHSILHFLVFLSFKQNERLKYLGVVCFGN